MLGLEGNIIRLDLERRLVGPHWDSTSSEWPTGNSVQCLNYGYGYGSLFLFVPGGVVSVRSSGLVQVGKQDLIVPN